MRIALMPVAQISTNVRFIAEIGLRRLALRVSSALAPALAGLWAEQLFLTPPRPRFPDADAFDLMDAHAAFTPYRGRRLATWRWGSIDAPAVLLAHGWGGRAVQLRGFVRPLLASGYRVIAYDQPAHGLSEGQLSGLPDFAGALAAIARQHGGVKAVVAHSLGATAGALAIARGLVVERIVLVSPPSDLVGYSRSFARWHWLPEPIRAAMQTAIEERYGLRWSELELDRLAPRLAAKALVVHDSGDRTVPYAQGERFARAWTGARLLETRGLGHRRVLEAPLVIAAGVEFLRGGGTADMRHAQGLPDPAPLY